MMTADKAKWVLRLVRDVEAKAQAEYTRLQVEHVGEIAMANKYEELHEGQLFTNPHDAKASRLGEAVVNARNHRDDAVQLTDFATARFFEGLDEKIELVEHFDNGRAVHDEEIEQDGAGAFETHVPFDRMKEIYGKLKTLLSEEWSKNGRV